MAMLIDFIYVVRELFKLSFMVVVSPFGLIASYLLMWE